MGDRCTDFVVSITHGYLASNHWAVPLRQQKQATETDDRRLISPTVASQATTGLCHAINRRRPPKSKRLASPRSHRNPMTLVCIFIPHRSGPPCMPQVTCERVQLHQQKHSTAAVVQRGYNVSVSVATDLNLAAVRLYPQGDYFS